ncbi:MAG: SH3 domain-containing protein [Roseburia sp.]|nr:SH3 domain-containing protein [Roseburia sp.]MCM1098508.1 SH3 domain-containing protein [Ruminococcus flavefaciens]
MRKDKWSSVRDFFIRNCKIAFPVLLIVIVAFTVVIALNANKARAEGENAQDSQESKTAEASQPEESEPVPEEVPLTVNEDPELGAFVEAYYTARGNGDEAGIRSAMDEINENDLLYYVELAKYIDQYTGLEIYCKRGLGEGTVIAYVYYKMGIVNFEETPVPGYEAFYICRDENNGLYIENQSNFTQEEREYIIAVNSQVDVVDFNNRVTVECTKVTDDNPELAEYVSLLDSRVRTAVGETLAARNAGEAAASEGENGEAEGGNAGAEQPAVTDTPVDEGPKYATATTTVNVRRSDSEQADKLGKVSGGTRVQVQEVQLNGWTKIVYDGKDGYIKSQYLQLEESVGSLEAIGTVTATTAVNVRAAADQSSTKMGVLPKGETLELFAVENDWCKVKYDGRVGYVKAEYVTQN